MPTFQIETYKVSTDLTRSDKLYKTRMLELIGPVQHHGIQNRVRIAFATVFDTAGWSNSVVGYLTDGGFQGLNVVGWFPDSEFSYYYDIVRSERPIHVQYEFQNSGATSGYLRKLGIGTSIEQIGEGPSDSEASISTLMAEQLSLIGPRHIAMPTIKDLQTNHK